MDGSQDNEYVSNPIVENYLGGGSGNYNYIINPKNGKKTKINTAAGKLILQNYFNELF
jgi:hypothetical protein